jgi:hypothetical protein
LVKARSDPKAAFASFEAVRPFADNPDESYGSRTLCAIAQNRRFLEYKERFVPSTDTLY